MIRRPKLGDRVTITQLIAGNIGSADLEGPSLMRLEPVGLPDPMDGFGAHAHHGGQGASRPVCGRWRWGRRGEGHDPLHGGGPDARRAAGARGVLLDASV